MSRADLTSLMLDASVKAYGGKDDLLNGYVLNIELSVLDTNDGFRALVFESEPDATGAKEYIVTFAGTEDLQDAYADLQLGWTQWKEHREDLINGLLAIKNIDKNTVHFTGHSLGGGLAQYAAYEYVAMYKLSHVDDLPNVTLSTFNAMGGLEGLVQHSDELLDQKPFEKDLLNDSDVQHIIVKGDLVSRIGGGHIGGNTLEISLGSAQYPALDFLKGHVLETFYDYFAENNVSAAAVFSGVRSTSIDYLDVSDGQRMAAQIARFFNDSEYNNEESALRLTSGILITLLAGSSATFETMANAIKDNYQAAGQYDSLNIGLKTLLYTFSNWSVIQTRVAAGTVGRLALELEALIVSSAVSADFIEKSDRDELNGLIAILAKDRIQNDDIGRIVFGKPGEAYLRSALMVASAIGTTEDKGISGIAQILYGDLSLADDEQAQYGLSLNLLSGKNWLKDSLEYLVDHANQQTGINLAKFGIDLGKAILSALDGLEIDSKKNYFNEVNSEIDLLIVGIAKSFANAAPDFIADYNPLELALAGAELVQDVSFQSVQDLFIQFDAELSTLKDSFTGIKSGIEAAKDIIANAWQTVDIAAGISGDLATVQWTELADISGNIAAYTVKLQFETSAEGGHIRLELPGGQDSQLRLIGSGLQDYNSVQLPQGGEVALFKDQYLLTLPGGIKEVQLFVVYTGDAANFPETGFDLKATLTNENWLDTHQEHFETQVKLGANDSLIYDQLIAGTSLDDNRLNGNDLADEIYGYQGNDNLFGQAGNDHLYGGSGDDILDTGSGDDQADGGQGRDILGGAGGNDTLRGGPEDDALAGGDGLDFLYGNDGSDVLSGGSGADFLHGGDGDDYILGDYSILAQDRNWSVTTDSNNVITFRNFTKFSTSGYDDLILGGKGNDVIWGDGGNDIIDGGADNDLIIGGTGSDQLTGGLGDDVLYGEEDNDIISGGSGNDFLWGGEGNDILHGGNDVDVLRGDGDHVSGEFHGADTLYGEQGNDELLGDGGNDRLFGGAGDDQLLGDAPDLEAKYHGNDFLEGGEGNDSLWGLGGSDILKGQEGDDYLDGDYLDLDIQNHGDDQLFGGAGSDTLLGRGGNDLLYGGDGDDSVRGQQGNDILTGGKGNDYLWGGEGNDTYRFTSGDGVDVIDDSEGINQIDFSIGKLPGSLVGGLIYDNEGSSYLGLNYGDGDTVYIKNGLQGGIETFNFGDTSLKYSEMIELSLNGPIDYQVTSSTGVVYSSRFGDNLRGSSNKDELHGQAGDDILVGGAGDDILYGDAGNDVLDGGLGADSLDGGTGDDQYYVDDRGDTVIERDNAGNDRVYSAIDYTLGANFEELMLTGEDNLRGIGNNLDNRLYGNSGDNLLYGRGGNDILLGAAGNDVLNGGRGADRLEGGEGDDRYFVDDIGDTVIEQDNAGNDRVYSTIDYTLGANLEQLVLRGETGLKGVGNELDNHLYGNSGNNTLSGQAGDDRLYGKEGDDILLGGAGNDVLQGGNGADTLEGGEGDDRYFVDDFGDTVIEQGNAGNDRVYSTIDYTLGANLEQLVLRGETGLKGVGNELDNHLYGNSGNNTLSGQAGDDRLYGKEGNDILQGGAGNDVLQGGNGADTLEGGEGDDRYFVDDFGDTVIEQGNAGNDRVYSTIDYTLGANLEQLVLRGETHLKGVGNELDNHLYGNSGNNTLSGQAGDDRLYGKEGNDILQGGAGNDALQGGNGADTLEGGEGDDRYFVDDIGDTVIEQDNAGNDRVYSTIDYTLGANLEQLVLRGETNLKGVGNELDNRLYGNSGNNVLLGQEGDDRLYGKEGNDSLRGGTGNDYLNGGKGDDIYTFARGDGRDGIVENDSTPGNRDVLNFVSDIDHDQLWFSRQGNHLKINVIGTLDQVTIRNWYSDASSQVETIQAADGLSVENNQVDQLVSAMATFNIPAQGELNLSKEIQEQIQPTLTATWT